MVVVEAGGKGRSNAVEEGRRGWWGRLGSDLQPQNTNNRKVKVWKRKKKYTKYDNDKMIINTVIHVIK